MISNLKSGISNAGRAPRRPWLYHFPKPGLLVRRARRNYQLRAALLAAGRAKLVASQDAAGRGLFGARWRAFRIGPVPLMRPGLVVATLLGTNSGFGGAALAALAVFCVSFFGGLLAWELLCWGLDW